MNLLTRFEIKDYHKYSRVIEDQVVVAGDEPLDPVGAVHILVAGALNRELSVQAGAVALPLRLLD